MHDEQVAVVGGRGFIGGHIVRRLLERGYRVRVLSSSGGPLKNLADLEPEQASKLELASVDFDAAASVGDACRDCTGIIHAGIPYAIYTLGWRKRWPREQQRLRTILELTRKAPVCRAVFVSVAGTVGPTAEPVCDERAPYRSQSRWTGLEMKQLAEQEILHADAPAIVANPALCFGDYDTIPSSGQYLLDFIHLPARFLDACPINVVDVRDVAAGVVAALEVGRIGERYLLGNENTTVGEFAAMVRRIAGTRRPMLGVSASVAGAGALASEVVGRLLHRPRPAWPVLGVDILRYGGHHYDLSKARGELALPQTPLEVTVRRALDWFRANGYL